MNKKIFLQTYRGLLAALSLITVFLPLVYAEESSSDAQYLLAASELQVLEPYFMREPIFLSKDEQLKDALREKLGAVIQSMEAYQISHAEEFEVNYLLGKAHSFAHDLDMPRSFQNSVRFLTRAIELNPHHEDSHGFMAKNYMDARQHEKALDEYKKAIAINPKGEAQKYIVAAELALGRKDEAKQSLMKYLESHPQDLQATGMLKALEAGALETNWKKADSKEADGAAGL